LGGGALRGRGRGWALVEEGKGEGKEREREAEGGKGRAPKLLLSQGPSEHCYATGNRGQLRTLILTLWKSVKLQAIRSRLLRKLLRLILNC